MMTILVFGKDGQVGRALHNVLSTQNQPDSIISQVIYLGRTDFDLSDLKKLEQVIQKYRPAIIINASAYTAVDKAESEPDLALTVNAKAVEVMAKYIAKQYQGLMIHFSTDYVFADTQTEPYHEDSPTGPSYDLSIYGQSKLAGEEAIRKAFSEEASHRSAYYILRTSWVYGDGGNFIKTIMRLAQEKESLHVVADQIGVPTAATFLAEVGQAILFSHIQSPPKTRSGVYHAVPNGSTSWHSLAVYIVNQMNHLGIATKVNSQTIVPIPATDYRVPAPRPYNSKLHNRKLKNFLIAQQSKLEFLDWQHEVKMYIQNLYS